MSGDMTCCKCGYYRGHPNRPAKKGDVNCSIFICSDCLNVYDNREERAEQRLGA
jgi:hypothetical protein